MFENGDSCFTCLKESYRSGSREVCLRYTFFVGIGGFAIRHKFKLLSSLLNEIITVWLDAIKTEYIHTLWNEVFRQKCVAVPPADCLYKSHGTYIVTFSFTLQLQLEFCNTIVYLHWNYWRCERTNEKHWQLCQGSWSSRNSWVSAWNWTFIFGRLVPKTPLQIINKHSKHSQKKVGPICVKFTQLSELSVHAHAS